MERVLPSVIPHPSNDINAHLIQTIGLHVVNMSAMDGSAAALGGSGASGAGVEPAGGVPAASAASGTSAGALGVVAGETFDEEDEEEDEEEDASASGTDDGAAGPGGARKGPLTAAMEERRRKTRENYSVRKKRELIALAQANGVRDVCRAEGIPRRTLRQWMKDADKINAFEGPDSRKSIGRSGRREILPFARELAAFLKEKRRQREVRPWRPWRP
jgi:transposase-like protein